MPIVFKEATSSWEFTPKASPGRTMNPKTATPADPELYKRVNGYYQDDLTEEKGTN